MQDMIEHMDELQELLLNPEPGFSTGIDPVTLHDLNIIGFKIKERLKHLVDEFDEHIRKSATIIDGVSLESQLEWNQIGRKDTVMNLKIERNGLKVAQHTRRDSELTKSIALLTMIFLPATFVAVGSVSSLPTMKSPSFPTHLTLSCSLQTLFSMGIYGEILSVSPYIWLYVAATVAITSLTLGTWYLWVKRRRVVDEDAKAQHQELGDKEAIGQGARSQEILGSKTLSPSSTISTLTSATLDGENHMWTKSEIGGVGR
ncbi:hypothetical protein F5Y14DRAFT_464349 [Nemania sp. NC0429]|nr:hypothetical protein F5Y14DRAFT_464349 [Nemania sp. NC0429]